MRNKKKGYLVLVFIIILIILAAGWAVISRLDFSSEKEIEFGVTFSQKYAAENLGLDWTEVYWQIISDLGVKKLRLIAQWDSIEEGKGEYNFNDLDWMITEAEKKGIEVILTIGRRTPRWPECHDPEWVKGLGKEDQDKALLQMIEEVVSYFCKYKNISAWQVENEPFLSVFGECPKPDKELLKQEIAIVKRLDSRPVIITDTGELSNWQEAAGVADILGNTLYKTVWNKYIGVWRYPWPPAYYYFKKQYIQNKYDNVKKVIVSELQAEPWEIKKKGIAEIDLSDQLRLFSLSDFRNNLEYAKKAGYEEAYLWGVEWWYWLKKEKNISVFWEEAKEIWQVD